MHDSTRADAFGGKAARRPQDEGRIGLQKPYEHGRYLLPLNDAFRKSISASDRESRDEQVKKCFRAGMNREQIVRLSQSWPHPLRSVQRVSQIQKRLRLVRSSPVQPHVRQTNEMLIDVILEGHSNGWRTFYWEKESSVYEIGLRSDFFIDMRKGTKAHVYFGELQISDLTVEAWIRKLVPYVELYDQRAHPFYVLIRCAGAYNRQRVLVAINEVLKDRKSDWPFLVSSESRWITRAGTVRGLLE